MPQNFASRDRCFWDGSRDASEEMDKESHTGIKRLYCRLFFSWLSKTQTSSRPKWAKPSAPIRSRRKYMQPAKSAGKTSVREQIPIEFEPVTENLMTGNQFNSEIKLSKLNIDTWKIKDFCSNKCDWNIKIKQLNFLQFPLVQQLAIEGGACSKNSDETTPTQKTVTKRCLVTCVVFVPNS